MELKLENSASSGGEFVFSPGTRHNCESEALPSGLSGGMRTSTKLSFHALAAEREIPTLQPRNVAVSLNVDTSKDMSRAVAELDSGLRSRKEDLMSELMRRALEQNPDIARELEMVEHGQDVVRSMRMEEQASAYRDWKRKVDEERSAQRHIKYNDSRNINALTGLRRSAMYQMSTRQRKIELELELYYGKYDVEPPPELLKELAKLRRAKELYLKRVKRDKYGRIIRPRMAG